MGNVLTCEVLVVGAGVAGAGAALSLGLKGVDTILVERETPASGPTGTSSAISHLFYMETELSILAQHGCQIFKDLPEMFGSPTVFHETGMLWGVGEKGLDDWKASVKRIKEQENGEIFFLGKKEASAIVPGFEMDGIVAGVWEPSYGYVDPYDATNEMVRVARENKVRYMGQSQVLSLETAGGRIQGVMLADGTKISTERVILACGPWTRALVAGLGVELPLFIERHFMAVLDAPGRAKEILPVCWCDDTANHYARPEGENTILLGTWDGGGTGIRDEEFHDKQTSRFHKVAVAGEFDDTSSTDESIWTIEHMLSRCPALSELGIRPGYSCMYDMSPDDMPILDEIPGAEGLFIAAGSSGHGLKLGPAVGEALANWATGQKSDLLTPFGLNRFEGFKS